MDDIKLVVVIFYFTLVLSLLMKWKSQKVPEEKDKTTILTNNTNAIILHKHLISLLRTVHCQKRMKKRERGVHHHMLCGCVDFSQGRENSHLTFRV